MAGNSTASGIVERVHTQVGDLVVEEQAVAAQMEAVDRQLQRLEQKVHKGGRVLDVFVQAGEAVSTGTPLLSLG